MDTLARTRAGITVVSELVIYRQPRKMNMMYILPGPEVSTLWILREGSRHREEREEEGLCVISSRI